MKTHSPNLQETPTHFAVVWRVRFNNCNACWKHIEVRRVRFYCSKACWRLGESVLTIGSVLEGSRGLEIPFLLLQNVLEACRVCFDYRKACFKAGRGSEVPFWFPLNVNLPGDSRKARISFVEVRRVDFHCHKRFGVSNLTTAKHVRRVRFYNCNKASFSEVFI